MIAEKMQSEVLKQITKLYERCDSLEETIESLQIEHEELMDIAANLTVAAEKRVA